ncbi:uncharacterized protein LOC111615106 [Centruroides sculpturatus]|uniref:uncharacterized protein LOC111615106 n=1 Tax=Centruroides sculpturatus TaxID=218467 RepID=UPI000C6D8C08|nr:uncharacterized protein LOC111615106 [Centruroides sculpturatus]
MSSDTDCEQQETVSRKKKFKRRRKCRKENCIPECRKNDSTNSVPVRGTRRCYSDFITQQRLTRRLGIYCRGKKSNTVTRSCEFEMSDETRARTQQDLNRILDFWAEKTLNSAKVNNSKNDLSNRLYSEKNSDEKLHESDSTPNSFQHEISSTPLNTQRKSPCSTLIPSTTLNAPLKEILGRFQKVMSSKCDQYFLRESIQENIRKKLMNMYCTNKTQDNSSQTSSPNTDYSQAKYRITENSLLSAGSEKLLLKSNSVDVNISYREDNCCKTDNELILGTCEMNSQLQSECLNAFGSLNSDKSDLAVSTILI